MDPATPSLYEDDIPLSPVADRMPASTPSRGWRQANSPAVQSRLAPRGNTSSILDRDSPAPVLPKLEVPASSPLARVQLPTRTPEMVQSTTAQVKSISGGATGEANRQAEGQYGIQEYGRIPSQYPQSSMQMHPLQGSMGYSPHLGYPQTGGLMGQSAPYGMYGSGMQMYGGPPVGGPQWLQSLHTAAGGASAVSELLLATSEVSARSAWALLALLERVGVGAARVVAFVRARPPLDPRTGQPKISVAEFQRHRKQLLVRWAAGLVVALGVAVAVRWAISSSSSSPSSSGGASSRPGFLTSRGQGVRRLLFISALVGAGAAAGYAARGALDVVAVHRGNFDGTSDLDTIQRGQRGLPAWLDHLPGGTWMRMQVERWISSYRRISSVAIEALLQAAGVDEVSTIGGDTGPASGGTAGLVTATSGFAENHAGGSTIQPATSSPFQSMSSRHIERGTDHFPQSPLNNPLLDPERDQFALGSGHVGARHSSHSPGGQERPTLWALPDARNGGSSRADGTSHHGGSPVPASAGPIDQQHALGRGQTELGSIMGIGHPRFEHMRGQGHAQGPGQNPFVQISGSNCLPSFAIRVQATGKPRCGSCDSARWQQAWHIATYRQCDSAVSIHILECMLEVQHTARQCNYYCHGKKKKKKRQEEESLFDTSGALKEPSTATTCTPFTIIAMADRSGLKDMLGPDLIAPNGRLGRTDDIILSDKQAVLLLFGANWCPPYAQFLRKFTPWYEKNARKPGQAFEVVFVSMDYEKSEFDRCIRGMPWPALPWEAAREDVTSNDGEVIPRRERLVQLLKVGSVPAVVIVGRDGQLISNDGRRAVDVDPEAAMFPWADTLGSVLSNAGRLVEADGSLGRTIGELRRTHAYVGLHFSAGWCEPCNVLRPALLDWVKARSASLDLCVVLVSMDRDESVFEAARSKYPFPALRWAARSVAGTAGRLLHVMALPTFAIIESKTGQVITTSAAELIRKDPTGFPWPLRPVENAFTVWRRALQFKHTVVLLTDRCSSSHEIDVATEALHEAVSMYFDPERKVVQACVCGSTDPETAMVRKVTHLKRDRSITALAAGKQLEVALSGSSADKDAAEGTAGPRNDAATTAGVGEANVRGGNGEDAASIEKSVDVDVDVDRDGRDMPVDESRGGLSRSPASEIDLVILRPTTDECWHFDPRSHCVPASPSHGGTIGSRGGGSRKSQSGISVVGLSGFIGDVIGGRLESIAIKFAD